MEGARWTLAVEKDVGRERVDSLRWVPDGAVSLIHAPRLEGTAVDGARVEGARDEDVRLL